jgi:hypothetical protein
MSNATGHRPPIADNRPLTTDRHVFGMAYRFLVLRWNIVA